MPDGRDAAVLRTIVANREGFLRYLLLLLQDVDDLPSVGDLVSAIGGTWNAAGGLDELPLLEELTRAYSRNPGRLDSVRKLRRTCSAKPLTPLLVHPAVKRERLLPASLRQAHAMPMRRQTEK
jgi:hypothetical protein